jgi:hypothetical protein
LSFKTKQYEGDLYSGHVLPVLAEPDHPGNSYVKVGMDPAGGSAFQVIETSQLLSVP